MPAAKTSKKTTSAEKTAKVSTKTSSVKPKTVQEDAVVVQPEVAATGTSSSSTKPKTRVGRSVLIGVIAFLFVAAIVGYQLRSQFVVAVVNGKLITRAAYVKQMELQVGQRTLDNMILEALILQEAAKQGVGVEQTELDAEIQKIESQVQSQGQTLDEILLQEGMTRSDLEQQLRVKKLVEKLAPKTEVASEGAIAAFLEENADFLPEEATQEELVEMAKERLSSQDGQAGVTAWLEQLKATANVQYWNQ